MASNPGFNDLNVKESYIFFFDSYVVVNKFSELIECHRSFHITLEFKKKLIIIISVPFSKDPKIKGYCSKYYYPNCPFFG